MANDLLLFLNVMNLKKKKSLVVLIESNNRTKYTRKSFIPRQTDRYPILTNEIIMDNK